MNIKSILKITISQALVEHEWELMKSLKTLTQPFRYQNKIKKMKEKIEVEFIGRLDNNKFLELKDFLKKNGSFMGKKSRLSLIYFMERIPNDLAEIKDENVDLRLRITNNSPELILKYGLFNSTHAREEISINFNKAYFGKYINLLNYLGWYFAVAYETVKYT